MVPFFVALSIEVLKNDRTVSVHHLSFLSQRINVHVLGSALSSPHATRYFVTCRSARTDWLSYGWLGSKGRSKQCVTKSGREAPGKEVVQLVVLNFLNLLPWHVMA